MFIFLQYVSSSKVYASFKYHFPVCDTRELILPAYYAVIPVLQIVRGLYAFDSAEVRMIARRRWPGGTPYVLCIYVA